MSIQKDTMRPGIALRDIFKKLILKFSPKNDDEKKKKREKRWVDINSVSIFSGHR